MRCVQCSTCSASVVTIAAKTMAKQPPQKKKASSESDELPRRLLASLQGESLIRAGDRVGVAVSGGADSVALLFLLLAIRKRLGIVLLVVHFNHQLRGRASDADEQFVVKLAARLGLDLQTHRADVARLAVRSKRNLEDAARRARYEWFSQIASEQHLTCIATAHAADDQAETVLAHIFRGTGLAGLAGIHPQAAGVIRPLLAFRRAELRAFLRLRKQKWREDATNRDTTRTRARIRRKLIPLLEKQFQPAVVDHLAGLADRARENETLLSALSEQARQSLVSSSPNGWRIHVRDLLAPLKLDHPNGLRALSARIVLDLAAQAKPRSGQLTAAHVDSVLQLAKKGEPGKTLQLPGGLRVRREHDAIVFHNSSV
jgi:tRNA(Ile)-lysidine synthase